MIADVPALAVDREHIFTLNPIEHTLEHPDGHTIALTSCEYRLLHYLVVHAGQIFSADHLLSKIWRYDIATASNLVPVYIRRLRTKIESEPKHPRHLITIRGRGYMFVY